MPDLRKLAEGADRVTFFQRGRKDGHPFVLPETILALLDEDERLRAALTALVRLVDEWREGAELDAPWMAAAEQARAALNADDR